MLNIINEKSRKHMKDPERTYIQITNFLIKKISEPYLQEPL